MNGVEDQVKQWCWEAFCDFHPHEAYEHDPESFWSYFHQKCPQTTREEMVAALKETE